MNQLTQLSLAKFGVTIQTIGITNNKELTQEIINKFYTKHVCADWGDLPQEDKEQNMEVLKKENGGNIYSVYKYNNIKFWIITSGYGNDPKNINMCYTTILLPSEY